MQAIRFIPYCGDTGELATNDNHLVFRWIEPEVKIIFSVTRKGDAAQCHLFCFNGTKRLKQACSEFVDFVFYLFDWCKMILVTSTKDSINRLLEKLKFELLYQGQEHKAYMRLKDGFY